MSKNQSSASQAAADVDAANAENQDTNDLPDEKEGTQDAGDDTAQDEEHEGEEGSEEGVEDDDASEESEQALRFYRALNDPNLGPALIANLAEKQGFKITGATKNEQADIVDSIEQLVSDELGADFKIFGGKLSTILKKIVPAIAKAEAAKVEQKYTTRENERLAREVKSAMDTAFASYKIVPNSVKRAMDRLMDEMPPVPGKTDPNKYFSRLIRLAADEVGVTLQVASGNSINKDKLNRNRRDASGRLASDRSSEVRESQAGRPKQFKDRRSAVEQAMKDVDKAIESGKLKA